MPPPVPTAGSTDGITVLEPSKALDALNLSERQVLSINRRMLAANGAPDTFPNFVREGFNVKVFGDGYVQDGPNK